MLYIDTREFVMLVGDPTCAPRVRDVVIIGLKGFTCCNTV